MTPLSRIARALGLVPDAPADSVYAAALVLIDAHNRLVEREASRGTGLHPLLVAYLDTLDATAASRNPTEAADTVSAVLRTSGEWVAAGRPRFANAPGNTVAVRIAVSVANANRWSAAGGSGWTDRETINEIEATKGRITWVSANVPLPSPAAEVRGEVSDG